MPIQSYNGKWGIKECSFHSGKTRVCDISILSSGFAVIH